MAYPTQTRLPPNNGYHDPSRQAPVGNHQGYVDDGYGGQYQQQAYGYDEGYNQGYQQSGQSRGAPAPHRGQHQQGPRPPRQQQQQGYPPPQGRSQPRPPRSGPGPAAHGSSRRAAPGANDAYGPVHGSRNDRQPPMRDDRGGGSGRGGYSDRGHQDRGGYGAPQQAHGKGGGNYQQNSSRGYDQGHHPQNGHTNGYTNGYDTQDQYQGQHDDGYGQEQYDDGYGYQQQDNYQHAQSFPQSQPQQRLPPPRQPQGSHRGQQPMQQDYSQSGYDQYPQNGRQAMSKSPPQQGHVQSQPMYEQYPSNGPAATRSPSQSQQVRGQDVYGQYTSNGHVITKPPPMMGQPPARQERERILPAHHTNSSDVASFDNPFPSFPPPDKKKLLDQRPSTSNGQYQERSGAQSGFTQGQSFHGAQDSYAPNGHTGAYGDSLTMSPPQPDFAQPHQRSNTMPTELTQNMANMSIQPSGANMQSHGMSDSVNNPPIQPRSPLKPQSPTQPLNFSQPRRPSLATHSGGNSRHGSHTRHTSSGNGVYDDLLDSYAESPTLGIEFTPDFVPHASPESEEMPDFSAAPKHGVDKTLHLASLPGATGDSRGRQHERGQDSRSKSQPNIRQPSDSYDRSNSMNTPAVPAMDSRYGQSNQQPQANQGFPPRGASNQQQFESAAPQQQHDQDQWFGKQPNGNTFDPHARARTDLGSSQAASSDPYNGVSGRNGTSISAPQSRQGPQSQNGMPMNGINSMNTSRTSIESMNRPRPGVSPTNVGVAVPLDPRMVSSESLSGHPPPVRPGLMAQSQTPPVNTSGIAARPPPVRNYNGNPSAGPGPQQGPPQSQQQQRPMQAQAPATNQQPVQQPIPDSEGPVTYEELQHLRGLVQRDPNDQVTQLRLAKRMVEAATTLSGEGGRADPKTKAKNRDRYMNDANRVVRKLIGLNNTDAMFYMAECYGNGALNLPKDPSQAFIYYQQAAKLNHAASAYRVAVCCELGSDEGGGTRRDPLKAVQWYQRAAQLGDVPAMYKIGVIKLKGLLGQPPNPSEAITWLKKAAEYADAENPHALHELALLYSSTGQSIGIAPDEGYAAQLMHQAADLGYKFSQFRLGAAYEYGTIGCPIDARQSITWYSKAAQQDEHQSELALSGWYLTGAEGIMAQNDTEAYLWARKAANANLAKAEYAMGYFTEVGIGCPADIEAAKRWYWKAASQNFPKARERLEDLRRGGPKMQKARVSRSAMHRTQGDCKVM